MDDGRYYKLGNKISDINIIDYFHLSLVFFILE